MSSRRQPTKSTLTGVFALVFAFLATFAMVAADRAEAANPCTPGNTYTANVVLFDTPMVFNRLGAQNPNWMMYALARDVIQVDPATGLPVPGFVPSSDLTVLQPGAVTLRPDKRPRPLVLRIPEDSCLEINFKNLLDPVPNPFNPAPPNVPNALPVDIVDINPALINNNQVVGRYAGVHVQGMQLVSSDTGNAIDADGSNVGAQGVIGAAAIKSGLVDHGQTIRYTLYAEREGAFLLTNQGATFGGEASGGNVGVGDFGTVIVQPKGARIYRSAVTEEEFRLAIVAIDTANPVAGPDENGNPQPRLDYEALYPADCDGQPDDPIPGDLLNGVWCDEGKDGLPVLNTIAPKAGYAGEIVHTEIDAIVAGPDADGTWTSACDGTTPGNPDCPYPLESVGLNNPVLPNRLEAFRDFASIWHDENAAAQAFPGFFNALLNPVLSHTVHGVRDSFMINYGSGGIGSEIIANRLGVGPMYDCLGCAFEEFFLTSFTVGDPAMRVDMPANVGLENCGAAGGPLTDCLATGPKATEALFPGDPANVHHSYMGDFAKFRNVHAGPKEQHVFHLHNHQWLFNPNDDNSNYIDAQGIGPGSSYTYEINQGGSGNRNKTAGDAIFHCHFYPHFAQGMWYMWRIHDVLETGTLLAVTPNDGSGNATGFHASAFDLQSGLPAAGARALPDGEIIGGTPIPAIVPLPGKAMAPIPAPVTVVAKDANGDGIMDSSQALVTRQTVNGPDGTAGTDDDHLQNPGYPFWVAGIEDIVGQRPPTPQLDMLPIADAEELIGLVPDDPTTPVGPDADLIAILNAAADPAAAKAAFVAAAGGFDGGLPRHALEGCKAAAGLVGGVGAVSCLDAVLNISADFSDPVTGDPIYESAQTRFDFHKQVLRSKAVIYPEEGTDLEKAAMAFHAQRNHVGNALLLPSGVIQNVSFVVNGGPPVPGAPYNEPCVDDQGDPLYAGVTGDFFDATGGVTFTGSSPRNASTPFVYKAANIQIDAVFNKVGYHYPQQRIIALWGDIVPTINKTKAPEPFVMRLNTFDCAKFLHSNLVPKEFEVDDYQVRAPTDIIGQHIHLPKWDLTTADGAANGWNYEDGTLSPGMVRERIHAIAAVPGGPTFTALDHPDPVLAAESQANGNEWLGARVTTQRWFADPIINTDLEDRGLGIIFTHDHYGPSTHQQIGLYATMLVEPAGSRWYFNELVAGQPVELGTRTDGGPTSWQAAIVPGTGAGADPNFTVPFREFYFEFSDFQHAYEPGVYVGAGPDGRPFTAPAGEATHVVNNAILPDGAFPGPGPVASVNQAFPVTADSFRNAINPSWRQQAAPILPDIVRFPPLCPGSTPGNPIPRPCPEAISADDPGMLVVNYRNEPVGLRVFDPLKLGPDGNFGTQADGDAGDLAMALSSGPIRAIPQLNVQPVAGAVAVPAIPIFDDGIMNTAFATTFPPPVNVGGVEPGDPFTPMMRTRAGDTVRVKIQGGGHEHEHDATIHGVKWLQSGSAHGRAPNSGWRNAQSDGISEQFTFRAPVVPDNGQVGNVADLAYSMDASQDGWWSGVWGILRNNNRPQNDLYELDNGINGNVGIANDRDLVGVCPEDPDQRNVPANLREYDVTAVLANEVLGNAVGATIPANTPAGPRAPGFFANDNEGGLLNTAGGTLVYNRRGGGVAGISDDATFNGPLHDPTAILYVRTQDLMFDPACLADGDPIDCRTALGNPTGLQPGAPVEPLVLRANAGDCVEVTLRNALPFDVVNVGTPEAPIFERVARPLPDLAGFNTQLPMVIRNRGDLIAVPPVLDVTSFNNNLVRPSSRIGLHAQLVEYDVTSDDGAAVGQSSPGQSLVDVGSQKLYRWYAGDIEITGTVRRGRNTDVVLGHTPIEFGGTNLIPSDKIKQGQKGMIGALVIEPADATWPEDDRTGATNLAALETTTHDRQGTAGVRRTRADMLVTAASTPKGSFNDLVVSVQKGLNPRYGDGTAVPNIAGEGGLIPEDSHDAGGKAVNYGTEPPWFRFGQPASTPFGALGLVANPEDLHANALAGEDPATPVFTATVGTETRMRVMEATGVGRGTTFSMHGHVWQRDPYGCLQDPANPALGFKTVDGLLGRCETTDVGSEAIGDNPIGMWLGGQESIMPYTNFEIRLESTGGEVPVTGDYLFRDQASFGHSDGIWGILRVAPAP